MTRRPLLLILTGFLLWSAIFVAMYALQATGCRLGWDSVQGFAGLSVQRLALVAFMLIFLAVAAAAFMMTCRQGGDVRSDGSARTFAHDVAYKVWLAALFAIPFTFAGVFWLTLC